MTGNPYLDRPPIRSVAEADIDLLLVEELLASADFRNWFVHRLCSNDVVPPEFLGAWRSVSTESGETDVLALFRRPQDASVAALLIENKIDAEFQERQPERYYERGEEGQRLGWWSDFQVCLIAPRKYLDGALAQFDRRLSYEAIRDWFAENSDDPHLAFKVAVFDAALQPRTWTRVPDETTTAFFRRYEEICETDFPRLRLSPKPERSAQDHWIYLYRADGLSNGVYIIHKCDRGFVDLTFPNWNADELQKTCSHLLEPGMTIEQTGKSAAIRLVAPPLDHRAAFDGQEAGVIAGLEAAEQLRSFVERHPAFLG